MKKSMLCLAACGLLLMALCPPAISAGPGFKLFGPKTHGYPRPYGYPHSHYWFPRYWSWQAFCHGPIYQQYTPVEIGIFPVDLHHEILPPHHLPPEHHTMPQPYPAEIPHLPAP